ncbi:flagellar motor protein [Sporolactobacillus sp. THM19-2]|uniref:flagellar motor protein n=1 Tax=Sporolactobacillus sp. THM19-2 TaxID=2511171 RepID=UPI00101F8E17|nr:flagellar motor protein [Sporolactobacillus sp. THM19-2]RYL93698.1 flagellar motor protein [Sporolactobacillus sp. THM19-2]
MAAATVIGLLTGILSLLLGFMLEGGTLGALFQVTALLIVFGGTIGAVIVSFPGATLAKLPFILKYAFARPKEKPGEVIARLMELANISRREGLLALESEQEKYRDDPFMSGGIQMVVDGVDSDVIDDILNRDIELYEQKILSIGRIFEEAGGFSPTMGIIGTVMGLVHVLGNLTSPTDLGPSIAVAFIATLYGVAGANVIFLPIFNKIKANLAQDVLIRQIKAEGILSIQYGENTMILRQKLFAFLSIDERAAAEEVISGSEAAGQANYQGAGSHE